MTAFLNSLKLLPINNFFQSLCLGQKGRFFNFCARDDEDPQEQVISIVNTATANGSGLGDGIATFTQNHGYSITANDVYTHADFLGQGDVDRV